MIRPFKRSFLLKPICKPFCDYGSQSYWDERYKNSKGTYEWYCTYNELKNLIHYYLPDKTGKILNVGCGNSLFPCEMYDDGYENITNIDYSRPVIKEMRKLNTIKYPKMRYKVMDVTDLNISDCYFDFVLDKGTLDALVCGEDEKQVKMLEEIERVLKYNGIYFCISHGPPEETFELFYGYGWKKKIYKVKKYYTSEDGKDYCYLYRMIKSHY
jgi:ubiquinone/menaquinone biosynthesis C-methylase UbiE